MARDDDDILLGSRVATSEGDSDGDLTRVERGDPRGDLGPATLESQTVVDPTANMPDGMTVETGLAGLTNLDGSNLRAGPDHLGVGADSILDGRVGGSPLDDVDNAASAQPPAPEMVGGRNMGLYGVVTGPRTRTLPLLRLPHPLILRISSITTPATTT